MLGASFVLEGGGEVSCPLAGTSACDGGWGAGGGAFSNSQDDMLWTESTLRKATSKAGAKIRKKKLNGGGMPGV